MVLNTEQPLEKYGYWDILGTFWSQQSWETRGAWGTYSLNTQAISQEYIGQEIILKVFEAWHFTCCIVLHLPKNWHLFALPPYQKRLRSRSIEIFALRIPHKYSQIWIKIGKTIKFSFFSKIHKVSLLIFVVHTLEIAKKAFKELRDATVIAFLEDTLVIQENGTETWSTVQL